MSFGGGSAPAQEPVPEKQATKSLTAGASAAAQAQRDKQKKHRGLAASILTKRNALTDTNMTPGKDTLG